MPSPTRPFECFDTPWICSNGQSEDRIGKLRKQRPQEPWMAAQFGIEPGTVSSVLTERVAAIAMRVFGSGRLAHLTDKALTPTLGRLVSAIAACSGVDELKRELQVARRFVPLSGVYALHCSARYCRWSSQSTFHGRQMIGTTPKLGICARSPHRFRLP